MTRDVDHDMTTVRLLADAGRTYICLDMDMAMNFVDEIERLRKVKRPWWCRLLGLY